MLVIIADWIIDIKEHKTEVVCIPEKLLYLRNHHYFLYGWLLLTSRVIISKKCNLNVTILENYTYKHITRRLNLICFHHIKQKVSSVNIPINKKQKKILMIIHRLLNRNDYICQIKLLSISSNFFLYYCIKEAIV